MGSGGYVLSGRSGESPTHGSNGMASMETLAAFLGWCTLINMGMLMFASLMLVSMRGTISKIHGNMFGLEEADLSRAYFQYLAQYKILLFVFNLMPYLALRIML